MDPARQVKPHHRWGERKGQLPLPTGNTPLPNAAQDTVSHLCLKDTLLALVRLGVHQDPQVLICKATFQLVTLQHVPVRDLLDRRTAPSSSSQSPHSSCYVLPPLSFYSHLELNEPGPSTPLLSAPILSPRVYCLQLFCNSLSFYFKIGDNSSFLPHPWTRITLQHPFVIDSTSFPDFPHRKNKSWLHAAAIKNWPGCVWRKEKEQLSGKRDDVW